MREKIVFCWSGGKDSALALYEIIRSKEFEIILLTNLSKEFSRISMHGVREELLDAQVVSLDLPLHKIYLSNSPTNEEYEKQMDLTLNSFKKHGISRVGFGDIFLEDLKIYREKNLEKVGMTGIFPIWKSPSVELANKFIKSGFKAIISCVDTKVLDKSFAGRVYDESFLNDLPDSVDPCGENGEFHSFVYDGPIFKKPVPVITGEKLLREERFYYCDLLLKS